MVRIIKQYKGLPNSVYVLFVARIINRMGGFVHMFLTLFLTQNMGLSKSETGFYMTAVGLAAMFGPFIGGGLADRLGRKKIYVAAQLLAVASLVPCGFLNDSIYIVWFLVIFNFLSSMIRPVNSAIITDLTPVERRKDAFSLQYLGTNFGVAVGPLIAGFLFNNYIEWIFWGDALTTLIAVILIIIYIPETKPDTQQLEEGRNLDTGERTEEGFTLKVLLKRPILLTFTLIGFLTSFIYAQHAFVIPMQLSDIFGDGAKYFGMLMSFNAIEVLVLTALVTYMTRKIKPIYNMAIANLFYIVGFGMLSFTYTLPLFYMSFFIWTIGEILATTNNGVFIANHTPMSHRGRFNAIINIIMGSGFTFGPGIAGLMLMNISIPQFWIVIAVISLVATLMLYTLGNVEERVEYKKEVNAE